MIRNIVFDVGNVFVCWAPAEVVERCFGVSPNDPASAVRVAELFGSPIWLAIARGELTRSQAEAAYRDQHRLTAAEADALFFHVMDHQVAVDGTENLALRLRQAGFRIFGLTDNIHEIVAHLKARYRFWDLFEGCVVSAEVGLLKPDPRIFRRLLDDFDLVASETLFLDDIAANVEGARGVGMQALVFTTADACTRDLRALGLTF